MRGTMSPRGLVLCGPREHVFECEGGEEGFRYHSAIPPTRPPRTLSYPRCCLLVVAGTPASGKTTLIERTAPVDAHVVHPDDVRERLEAEAGVEGYDPSFWRPAWLELQESMGASLDQGRPVILHSTCLQRWQQDQATDLARSHGCEAHVLFLDVSLATCLEGQARRERQVPEDVIEEHAARWTMLKEDLLKDTVEGRPRFRALGRDWVDRRGFSSAVIMDRPSVDALRQIRFG
jgi:predicted kinase